MDAGLIPHDKGRALQLRALEVYERLHGLRRAPEPVRVKVTGSGGKPAGLDPALLDALSAIDADELIDALLPDGRNPR